MTPGLLPAACALRLAVGAAAYDVSLGAAAMGRAGTAYVGMDRQVEADARVGVVVTQRTLEVDGAYLPRVLLHDPGGGVQVLHRAHVGSVLPAGGRRTFASVDASYGTTDLVALQRPDAGAVTAGPGVPDPSSPTPSPGGGPPRGAPVQTVPVLGPLTYVSGEASLGVDGARGGRASWSARLDGLVSGGADEDARRSLPLQVGARGRAQFDWMVSHRDTVATDLTAEVSGFRAVAAGTPPGDVRDGYAVLSEAWRRVVRPEMTLRVALGPGFTVHHAAGSTTWGPSLAAAAGLGGVLLRTVRGDVALRALPVVDRVTGNVYERGDVTGWVAWEPSRAWAATLAGNAGVVLRSAQAGDKVAAADLGIAWSPDAHWRLGAGVRAYAQSPRSAGTPALSEVSGYVAVTVGRRGRM
jgi:hypothetical protein